MIPRREALSWERVRGATKELLAGKMDRSWGEFKLEIAKKLEVTVESLKPWKTDMKQVIAVGVNGASDNNSDHENAANNPSEEKFQSESEKEGESEGDDSGECGSDEDTKREATKRKGTTSASVSSRGDEDSDAMKALKRMSRAMALGPKPFQGLKKKSKSDAETTLTNRLIEAGAPFKGPFPSPREIAQAQRETDKAKDLEGIDMGNVVQGSRRRGRVDTVSPPKKKRRSVDAKDGGSRCDNSDASGSDLSECESSTGHGDEDSEEEFEFSP